MSKKSGICLTMIVKNEEQHIKKCLRSALPFCRAMAIFDTGSTDATFAIMKEFGDSIPVEKCRFGIQKQDWKNFSANRNESIQEVKSWMADEAKHSHPQFPDCQWLLLLDGDEELVVTDPDWLNKLDPKEPGYNLEFTGNIRWSLPLLVNTDFDWKYVGACHEYIIAPRVDPSKMRKLPGVQVLHLENGERYPEKLQRNLDLLLAENQEQPKNERTLFYLGNTYYDLGKYEVARNYYDQRVACGGWAEEVFFAMYRKGVCLEQGKLGDPVADYLAAWNYRPTRVEPILRATMWLRTKEQYFAAYALSAQAVKVNLPGDILFVDVNAHEWESALEHAALCIATGRCREAVEIIAPYTGKPGPEKYRDVAAANLKTALSRI